MPLAVAQHNPPNGARNCAWPGGLHRSAQALPSGIERCCCANRQAPEPESHGPGTDGVGGRGEPMRAIDLLDGDMYANGAFETYAWLRENAPVYWDGTNELWGISRYDDILEIEKRKDIFVSSDKVKGGYRPNIPADDAIIGLDDPLHS